MYYGIQHMIDHLSIDDCYRYFRSVEHMPAARAIARARELVESQCGLAKIYVAAYMLPENTPARQTPLPLP